MTALTLRADEAAALWRDGAVVVRRPAYCKAGRSLVRCSDVDAPVRWGAWCVAWHLGGATRTILYKVNHFLNKPGRRWLVRPKQYPDLRGVIASVEVEAEPWTWVVRVEVADG